MVTLLESRPVPRNFSTTSKLLSTAALAAVLLSVSACGSTSGATEGAAADCAATKSGASSEKVKVTGEADAAPKVEFPTPLTVTTTERSVITAGKGKAAVKGSTVSVSISVYNATTGAVVDQLTTPVGEPQEIKLEDPLIAGVSKALLCSSAGGRVVAVIPPEEAFGENGTEINVAATDSLVFVADVIEVKKPVKALKKADGADQPAVDGLPTVTLAEDGAPSIAVPKADPPSELKIAVLKEGDGAEVAEGASVTVHYTGVIWASGEVFDSSWESGSPATFTTDGVIAGFSKALVGQKVGSQVLAVIPPAEGYGDAGSGTIKGTDTIVFVVDILATQ